MSSVRTTVIENFLTAAESDENIPPAVSVEVRKLLTADRMPSTEQVVALIHEHAGSAGSAGAAS